MRFQELRIQEQSGDVPAGHVPRSLVVYCRGETTRQATAGDHVAVTGVFLPLAKSSAFAQAQSGLLTDTYLEAHVSTKYIDLSNFMRKNPVLDSSFITHYYVFFMFSVSFHCLNGMMGK